MTQPHTDQRCRITTYENTDGTRVGVTCLAHDSSVAGPKNTKNVLLREFRCDMGRDWRFLVRDCESAVPSRLANLTELAMQIRSSIESQHYIGEPRDLVIRRWIDDDTLEPLTLAHEPSGDEWARDPEHDDAPATRHPQYRLTGPDGTRYLHLTVALQEI